MTTKTIWYGRRRYRVDVSAGREFIVSDVSNANATMPLGRVTVAVSGECGFAGLDEDLENLVLDVVRHAFPLATCRVNDDAR